MIRIRTVDAMGGFRVRLGFTDGSVGEVDLAPYLKGEVFRPLVEDPTLSGLERLLRVSSARGASTLYLSSNSRPWSCIFFQIE